VERNLESGHIGLARPRTTSSTPDTEEIEAARWGTLDELAGPLRERLLRRAGLLALPGRAARRGAGRLERTRKVNTGPVGFGAGEAGSPRSRERADEEDPASGCGGCRRRANGY